MRWSGLVLQADAWAWQRGVLYRMQEGQRMEYWEKNVCFMAPWALDCDCGLGELKAEDKLIVREIGVRRGPTRKGGQEE